MNDIQINEQLLVDNWPILTKRKRYGERGRHTTFKIIAKRHI